MIGNESAYKQIHSGEYSSSDVRPCVVMNYNARFSIPSTFTVGKGTSREIPLKAYPSSVTATWTPEDKDIATIDENGHVVGVSLGTTKITGVFYSTDNDSYVGSISASVCVIPISEGEYFIENRFFETVNQNEVKTDGKYFFLENNNGSLILNHTSGMASERWNVSYVYRSASEGFYLIESVSSPGHYLTVNQNDTQTNASVILGTNQNSNYARWRFTQIAEGASSASTDDVYTLTTVKSEGTGLVLSVNATEDENDGSTERNYYGIPLQTTYTNSSYYSDKWTFHPVHVSLPTSGSEIAYEPWKWNTSPIKENANCYAYALNAQERPDGDFSSVHISDSFVLWPGMSLDNGWVFGSQCTPYDSTIIQYTISDAQKIGFTFERIERYDVCDTGCYKVALVIAESEGYHWYRQNPDGTWSHKENQSTVLNTDSSGNFIYDPLVSDRGQYTAFIGYFQISPLNLMVN